MSERYTDEQILQEGKQVLADPKMRRCNMCSHYQPIDARTGRCEILGTILPVYTYSGMCKTFETNEEKLLREAKERIAELALEERKLNHLLTMSLNFIESSLLTLEDFEARIEKEFKKAEAQGTGDRRARANDRQWIGNLRKAMKNMKTHLEGVRKQYTHYVEPHLNKIFTDKETLEYDCVEYDNHLSDAYELTRLGLMYFEKAFNSQENAEKVFNLLNGMQGYGVLTDKDLQRYIIKV